MARIETKVEDPFSPDNYGNDEPQLRISQPEPELKADADGFVHTESLEGPGFIIDAFSGKRWAVPTGQHADRIKPHSSPYDFPKDPTFHYAVYRMNEVKDMESQGFVKVTRKEVEGENYHEEDALASPMDSYFTIGGSGDEGSVVMKIPQVIADQRYAAQKEFCDAAVAATEPKSEKEKEATLERRRQRSFNKEGYRI